MKFAELITVVKQELKHLSTLDNPDFRLEEAEQYDDKSWNLVVSYLVENSNKKLTSLNAFGATFEFLRLYKKVKISENGEILGIYMYND